MLGQLSLATCYDTDIRALNDHAHENYKVIISSCRYPNLIIDYSNGTLIHRWGDNPEMMNWVRYFMDHIVYKLQSRYEMLELSYSSVDEYKPSFTLESLERVNRVMRERLYV
jgi:hypothetical protein